MLMKILNLKDSLQRNLESDPNIYVIWLTNQLAPSDSSIYCWQTEKAAPCFQNEPGLNGPISSFIWQL